MTFTPSRLSITGITKANPAVVTTSTNHNLTTGQVVRVNVPLNYGMVEINKLQASITVISPTTFSLQYSQVPPPVNVDSTNYTTFTTPAEPGATAEILPMGSGTTPVTNTPVQQITTFCDTLLGDATVNVAT